MELFIPFCFGFNTDECSIADCPLLEKCGDMYARIHEYDESEDEALLKEDTLEFKDKSTVDEELEYNNIYMINTAKRTALEVVQEEAIDLFYNQLDSKVLTRVTNDFSKVRIIQEIFHESELKLRTNMGRIDFYEHDPENYFMCVLME